jgi:alpha-galactosidase
MLMKPRHIIIGLIFLAIHGLSSAQPYASRSENTITLNNGVIKRVIQIDTDNHGLILKSFSLNKSGNEFLSSGSEDFYFEADGKPVTGLDNWKLVSADMISGENNGNGANVILEHPTLNIKISITYLLYPDLPIVRKKITFLNTGKQELKLEALDIESLKFEDSGTGTECWVMHDYARQKSLGQFIGNWYDPVVVVHEIRRHRGVVLGNEAPGVMKRTAVFQKPDQLTAGLTHSDQNFGFRKWLKPDEPWESTWVFTGIYDNSDDPYAVLNGAVNDFVRRHMGTRLSKIPEKPVFVYNTWEPFLHDINEKMIFELADAASECGIEEFVIDDGWQDSYGDWGVNKQKFPNGLKPVFDYIKSKGMKPGVWISLGSAESKSKVYKDHPEWAVRKADGSPISLHADFDKMYGWETYSMCITTGWYDHIKGVILRMAKEYGLEYIKGDFAVVTGAYTTDKTRSGCFATDHTMHKDRNESMLEMYRRTWHLFDDLHKEVPELFIDCTFETMGALQLIDFDMCKHAEGNWLSNFGEKAPLGSMRVRQMSWWRSPVIPSTAMVIGNQRFDDPDFELSLKSLAGSLPIVLGDPRLLTKEQRARMKTWADWLRNMQKHHDFMSFRQDLNGYGEPAEGNWDGYQRINSETRSGGIVGIFRQGSPENQRIVTVQFLDPFSYYEVKKAPIGEIIMTATGKELSEKGFMVTFNKKYDGAVFEILKE